MTEISEFLTRPECEEFDRKSALNPSVSEDYLELSAHLVAMANTRGGSVLIGTKGTALEKSGLPLFDSARLDDKINSIIEPRLGGIRSSVWNDDFVLVEIEKSANPPHVFKQDGTYMNKQGKNAWVFRKGDVFVRHSSKSERAGRADFDRWFEERRLKLFENVRVVFNAGPQARVEIDEDNGSVPVRIDPSSPEAQPVYDLLTSEPFRDLLQELTGGLKAWKTSHQLLNEAQIYKACAGRKQIDDAEIVELVLRSSWERHMPGYCWAAKLAPRRLAELLAEVIVSDHYPGSQEALKIAALFPRDHAKKLFGLIDASHRKSVKKAVKKFENVLRARARKFEALVEVLSPGQKIVFLAGEGTKEVKLDLVNEGTFEEILRSLLDGRKENRGALKGADLLVYGKLVAGIESTSLEATETGVSDGSVSEGNG